MHGQGRVDATGAFAEQRIVLISEHGQHQTSRALNELRQCGYLPAETYKISSAKLDGAGVVKSLNQKVQDIVTASQGRPDRNHVYGRIAAGAAVGVRAVSQARL